MFKVRSRTSHLELLPFSPAPSRRRLLDSCVRTTARDLPKVPELAAFQPGEGPVP